MTKHQNHLNHLSHLTDIDVVKAVREGDYDAFCEIYRRYSDMIYRNILVRVNHSFDADDIFQEFFVRLWVGRQKLNIESNVRGYLLTALRNHILNYIKESQVRLRHNASGSDNDPFAAQEYEWVRITTRDILSQLQRIVNRFPPRMKAVYILRREQNLSIREIAEKLSISEQTVKNQINESIRRLKEEVESKNFCVFL